MSNELLEIFDAWNIDLEKARKAKGLAKWDRLAYMAEKLKDKKASDIMFTTSYPGQEGKKKILGSVEGNLHCLLGYISPGFHFAPYHYQVIDSSTTDEEAEELYRVKGHPARPELWKRSGLDVSDEGDLELGNPHPSVTTDRDMEVTEVVKQAENVTVRSGAGTYIVSPVDGLIYGKHNNHIYKWDLVKDSFLVAANPDLLELMEPEEEVEEAQLEEDSNVPEIIKSIAGVPLEFDSNVYDLVKTKFPCPGSVIHLITDKKEPVYGVVTAKSIDFYDTRGFGINVLVYDRLLNSIDLCKGGDVHPSVVYNFACANFDFMSELNK